MLETRVSLLERVRDAADAAAWSEFVALYQPLLRSYVRKRGVNEHDADDVVQDVFTRLVPVLARFELDPVRGRFRTWLWQVTHSALADWARRRGVRARAEQGWADLQQPAATEEPEAEWRDMYHRRILEVVLARVRESAQTTSWACFEGRILEGRPAAELAAELGVSSNAVYVNASRLLARVRDDCAEFLEPLEGHDEILPG
ncbi:MAG TPA: sigma-70 family RNA polymerase sigma factor [Pirellulales bacterium]|nr:sigma-70 family RNA polymerase sigma factor [Pirellulales bacterium]